MGITASTARRRLLSFSGCGCFAAVLKFCCAAVMLYVLLLVLEQLLLLLPLLKLK